MHLKIARLFTITVLGILGAASILHAQKVSSERMVIHADGEGTISQEPCTTQLGRGTIVVFVWDRESSKIIPNVVIVLGSYYVDSSGIGHEWCCSSAILDSTGYLKLCNLEPGTYEISAIRKGYEGDTFTDRIEPDSTYFHDLRLKKLQDSK